MGEVKGGPVKLMRTEKQVEKVLNQCVEMEGGRNPFWGMTYAQGVEAGIRWIIGETDEDPLAE